MRSGLIVTVLLILGPLTGQGFTSPPGYLSTEGLGYQGIAGQGYGSVFGGYAFGRYQILDGDIKKKGTTVLTSLGFRVDHRSHSTGTARARKWSNVSLTLADGDFAKMTNTFSTNRLSTPRQVFLGSVAWPGYTGYPSSRPAAWHPGLRFPFKGSHVYLATKDLLLEFQFYGGTLANTNWPVSTRATYYLDGLATRTRWIFGRNEHKTTSRCRDSAITTSWAHASSLIQVHLYSEAYPYNGTNSVYLSMFGYHTAPNAPVTNALSFKGSTPGIDIGAACNRLMIDLFGPSVYITDKADYRGAQKWKSFRLGPLSALRRYGKSVTLWSQASWRDSSTGRFSLTSASECTPDLAYKLNTALPRRKMLYATYSYPTGFGPYDWSDYTTTMHPILRYN